ncbi:hypothetical protein N836_27220 [Leptolyngbya sp. Heron Island J]|uniref:DUF4058 family protein n=1 Tax=Leptolyngbya sp. Heron Island J TaxID=1385935 RepID=UPI0003B9C5E6|nr:DUF4058 family protein [Leptolyngbya sp. Heron Island J]ESA32283.1 hypothetical protein N836_27220 [Leptolyngbya sp. Heron Island J]
MPSPFPGMDPYLEQPTFWSSFHSRLIVALADTLAPQLRPHYFIEVETRTYNDTSDGELLVGIPDAVVLAGIAPSHSKTTDSTSTPTTAGQFQPQIVTLPMPVEIKERYLEVREVGSNAVIAVIEVLSPKNKRKGKGRRVYEEKRQTILSSASHLIEIDLLRGESPMPMQGAVQPAHYRILVSRAEQRPQAKLYAATIREPLPEFPVPLKADTESVLVNLQAILAGVYERASYDLRIDYSQPLPPPSFSDPDKDWIAALIKSA